MPALSEYGPEHDLICKWVAEGKIRWDGERWRPADESGDPRWPFNDYPPPLAFVGSPL